MTNSSSDGTKYVATIAGGLLKELSYRSLFGLLWWTRGQDACLWETNYRLRKSFFDTTLGQLRGH